MDGELAAVVGSPRPCLNPLRSGSDEMRPRCSQRQGLHPVYPPPGLPVCAAAAHPAADPNAGHVEVAVNRDAASACPCGGGLDVEHLKEALLARLWLAGVIVTSHQEATLSGTQPTSRLTAILPRIKSFQ